MGPQTRVPIAGLTRRLQRRLNPKNGGAVLVVAGLVFIFNAKSRNYRNCYSCLRPRGAPLRLGEYAFRLVTSGGDRRRLGPGKAVKVAPWKVRVGSVVHTTCMPPQEAREGASYF